MAQRTVTVVGAGLAGVETAWLLANAGFSVSLLEMRPRRFSPAHQTDLFAELVCSNSFKGRQLHQAAGLLKEELRTLGSLVMEAADLHAVAAGDALAVDRTAFSRAVTRSIRFHPRVTVSHQQVMDVPPFADGAVVIATGPLTSDRLAAALVRLAGQAALSFYDAIAPVVDGRSVDRRLAFPAGRHGRDDDYLNCPLDEAEYDRFVLQLLAAQVTAGRPFEEPHYFEACMPIEVLAARGPMNPAFGPMRPVGLIDPRTGRPPFAVVQLRREDTAGLAYNLVGFQTRLKYGEQKRVFSLIPGLAKAEFLRFGAVHRNTYLCGPAVLDDALRLRAAPHVRIAGQLTGVEGYLECAATGMLAALSLLAQWQGRPWIAPPPTTALGGLIHHVARGNPEHFEPSHFHWGMVPACKARTKTLMREKAAQRALNDIRSWASALAGSRSTG